MVAVLVCFFIAMGFAWLGYQDAAAARLQAETARAEAAEAKSKLEPETEQLSRISRAVGWYDPQASAPRTNVETLGSDLEELRSAFTDLGPDVRTLGDAIPVLKQTYVACQQEVAQLTDTKNKLVSERQTLEQSLRDVIREKDTQIANLQRQLQDESANAAQRQSELENRITALNNQRNTLDAELRTQRGASEEEKRKHEAEKQTWTTREQATRRVLGFLDEPEAPDASVLAVSKDLALGWIDIGTEHRLAVGTRFRVISGRIGSKTVKGWAEVTRVEPRRAEVAFTEIADRFNPIVPGDKVYNPLFDPTGERKAVLAGRFSAPYDEREVELLLRNMGIEVQDELAFDTDYLIVGSELFVDEEGNPLEEPLQPSELPVYKDAEAMGVQIVPIKDLRSYFKF